MKKLLDQVNIFSLSMFPRLHLLQTETLNFQIAEGGGELGVHQYLIIFLKFVQVYLVIIIYLYRVSLKKGNIAIVV